MDREIWKPIPDFPGYEASSHGRIRSFKKRVGHKGEGAKWEIMDTPQRLLSIHENGDYPSVAISRNGRARPFKVHQLVMLAFHGLPPDGLEVCHNDSDPKNNHLSNLRYDTRTGNLADRHEHIAARNKEIQDKWLAGISQDILCEEYSLSLGTVRAICREIKTCKLTEAQVIEIRNRRARGEGLLDIAEDYDRGESAICRICRGEYYKDIGGPITVGTVSTCSTRRNKDAAPALPERQTRCPICGFDNKKEDECSTMPFIRSEKTILVRAEGSSSSYRQYLYICPKCRAVFAG